MNWKPNRLQETWLRDSSVFAEWKSKVGGGKTDALLAGSLRLICQPHYRALMVHPGAPFSFLDRAAFFYRALGGKPKGGANLGHVWTFPSGARILCMYPNTVNDLWGVAGSSFQYIGVDLEPQWLKDARPFLRSRLRQRQRGDDFASTDLGMSISMLDQPQRDEAMKSELPLRFRVCVHENEPELTIKISIPKEDPPTPPCSCCVGSCGRP